ncbi:MAG TPA: cupin domain-containing protein [Candidatus Binatia bacterium]|nr:cupin domain-containing protein [Candidatus Binatia bacterium]
MVQRFDTQSALKMLAAAGGARYVTMFHHGSLELEFYAPQGSDPQKPHTRDEVYFVVSGSGWFVAGGERQRCGPGAVMYVPAGVPHRFEEFSADFATWAIFAPAAAA